MIDSELIEVLALVADERAAQDETWGEQNHKDLTGLAGDRERADAARASCDEFAKIHCVSWRDILTEEFYEVLAETDPEKLEAELVQLAAVAVNWVQASRRRRGL